MKETKPSLFNYTVTNYLRAALVVFLFMMVGIFSAVVYQMNFDTISLIAWFASIFVCLDYILFWNSFAQEGYKKSKKRK